MNEDDKRQLGKVTSVFFGLEDHGCMTFWIHLDYGGSGQGFGGVALDQWSKGDDRRVGTAAGLDLLIQLLELFGVDTLEKIVGRSVYALHEDGGGWNASVVGLQLPAFDGGKQLLLDDWRKRWFREAS